MLSLQLKRVMESDAAMTEDLIAYNIIPLDGPSITNVIASLPEVIVHFLRFRSIYILFYLLFFLAQRIYQVQAAILALMYHRDLPKLPPDADFSIPATRKADMLDFLHYIFGFQVCASLIKCYIGLIFICVLSLYYMSSGTLSLIKLLNYLFEMFYHGCQRDNVCNQREHIVHLLANEQSQLRILEETEPVSLIALLF